LIGDLPRLVSSWHNTVSDSCRATMMQTTFSDAEFTNKKKQTRRDRFLAEIEERMTREACNGRLYANPEGCVM